MAYSSSKTALNAITVHYAQELAGTAVKVNGAAPGHVATDFNGSAAPGRRSRARPSPSGSPRWAGTGRPAAFSTTVRR